MKIVHFVSTKPQMTGKPERTPEVQGEAQDDGRREEVQTAKNGAEHSGMCLADSEE